MSTLHKVRYRAQKRPVSTPHPSENWGAVNHHRRTLNPRATQVGAASNKGKRYAYYHCRSGPCRLTNIPKAKLEGVFAEALEQLQPTPGYMRLVKETVLAASEQQKTTKTEAQNAARTVSAIQGRLDKLDDAYLFEERIDSQTYERQRDRLREEMTIAKMAKHSSDLDDLDVEGILAFAERVLPRASDVWIQASLAQRQQLQKLFFS